MDFTLAGTVIPVRNVFPPKKPGAISTTPSGIVYSVSVFAPGYATIFFISAE